MSNVSFICRRCGTCCKWPGDVRLFSFEVEKIADFLDLSIHAFTDKYTILTRDRRNLSLIENPDGQCIFLSDNSQGCIIEAIKPQQCRNFPLKWNFPNWEKECAGKIITPTSAGDDND